MYSEIDFNTIGGYQVEVDYINKDDQKVTIKDKNSIPVHEIYINTGIELSPCESHKYILESSIENIIENIDTPEHYRNLSQIVFEFLPPYNEEKYLYDVSDIADRIIEKYNKNKSDVVDIHEETTYYKGIRDSKFKVELNYLNYSSIVMYICDVEDDTDFVINTKPMFDIFYLKLFWIIVINFFIGNLVVKLDK